MLGKLKTCSQLKACIVAFTITASVYMYMVMETGQMKGAARRTVPAPLLSEIHTQASTEEGKECALYFFSVYSWIGLAPILGST